MKAFVDCIHCYLKQAVSCMVMADVPDQTKTEVLYSLMDYIKTFNVTDSPAYNSSLALFKTYELINNSDPYYNVKRYSNDLALKLYDGLKNIVLSSEDPLYTSLKVAVVGNVIDLGIKRNFDIDEELKKALNIGFSWNDYKRFKKKVCDGSHVVIVGDNAGEIVFDKILAEVLSLLNKKVYYIVKSNPILNDATMEDVLYVGMQDVATIIETGTNFLGFPREHVSEQARDLLLNSDVIISKGQANLESLDDWDDIKDSIFFLLKIKCEYLAQSLGFNMGDLVFINSVNLKQG